MDNYHIEGVPHIKEPKLTENKKKQSKAKGKYLINYHQKPKKNKMRYLQYFSTSHYKNPSTEANSTCQSSWFYDKLKLTESNIGKCDRSVSVKHKQKICSSTDRIKSQNPQSGKKEKQKSVQNYLTKDIRLRIKEEKLIQEWKELLTEYTNVYPDKEKEVKVILKQFQKISSLKHKQEESKYRIFSQIGI